MLCGPCRAALKRARYVSVQEIAPSSLMQRQSHRRRRAVSAGAADARTPRATRLHAEVASQSASAHSTAVRASSNPRTRTLATGIAALALLGLIAYFAQPHAPAIDSATTQSSAGSAPAADAVSASSIASRAAMAATPVANTSGNIGVMPGSVDTRNADSPKSAVAVPVDAKPAARRAASPPPVRAETSVLVTAQTVIDASPAVDAPRPAPVPPAAAPVPPPPDRWQAMNDELARCDREGGFGGFICDQRIRLDACEGFWGRVPQCPVPPENPRGQ
ncbi:MAG: hypothetical protein ABI777_01115 [Betaproteobacteria bacterium]